MPKVSTTDVLLVTFMQVQVSWNKKCDRHSMIIIINKKNNSNSNGLAEFGF